MQRNPRSNQQQKFSQNQKFQRQTQTKMNPPQKHSVKNELTHQEQPRQDQHVKYSPPLLYVSQAPVYLPQSVQQQQSYDVQWPPLPSVQQPLWVTPHPYRQGQVRGNDMNHKLNQFHIPLSNRYDLLSGNW